MQNTQLKDNNYQSLYNTCKTDSILAQLNQAELHTLKPYWHILNKLIALKPKAAYSISHLQNNTTKPYSIYQDLPILQDFCKDNFIPKNAFNLYFYRYDNIHTNTTPYYIQDQDITALQTLALELKPWRKGPFCFYYLSPDIQATNTILQKENTQQEYFYIDSEWQSTKKMQLILQALHTINFTLENKLVLDVGCNNGYYMFDLALRGVKHITGIDPIAIFFLQFYFIYKLSSIQHCSFRLLGVQDVAQLHNKYDLILCLGVLYHRKEPLQTLKQLKSVLQPNGILILETLIIHDDMPICLCPYPTYAKMSNVFYIFSPSALKNCALHAGFKTCELLSFSYTDNTEQRTTDFINTQSLGDSLLATQTIEGYPPACRGIFVLSC